MLLVYGSVLFANRVKNWQRGRPDNRSTTRANAPRRMADFRAGVYMQTLLREPAAGVMHSMIYFGFLVLLAVTTTLEVNHQVPEDLKFLHGDVYRAYSVIGDAAGALFVLGIVWAIVRRFGPPPVPALSNPDQVAPRARRHPRGFSRHRGQRSTHRGVPHRRR